MRHVRAISDIPTGSAMVKTFFDMIELPRVAAIDASAMPTSMLAGNGVDRM